MRAGGRVRVVESDRPDQPQKRRFIEYRLVRRDEGADFGVVDIFDEFNPVIDDYVRKREATSIQVPLHMGETFVRTCTAIRRELDIFGLKMFFDPVDRNGRIRPKWRYRLAGRMRTDFADVGGSPDADPYEADPDLVPEDIIDMVRSDREYYIRKPWKDWFGRKLQRKREDVVSREAVEALRSTDWAGSGMSGSDWRGPDQKKP